MFGTYVGRPLTSWVCSEHHRLFSVPLNVKHIIKDLQELAKMARAIRNNRKCRWSLGTMATRRIRYLIVHLLPYESSTWNYNFYIWRNALWLYAPDHERVPGTRLKMKRSGWERVSGQIKGSKIFGTVGNTQEYIYMSFQHGSYNLQRGTTFLNCNSTDRIVRIERTWSFYLIIGGSYNSCDSTYFYVRLTINYSENIERGTH